MEVQSGSDSGREDALAEQEHQSGPRRRSTQSECERYFRNEPAPDLYDTEAEKYATAAD